MKHYVRFLLPKKQVLILLLFSLISLFGTSQKESITITVAELEIDQPKTIFQDSMVKIKVVKINYSNNLDGISHERLTYIYENLSSKKITLNLKRTFSYDQKPILPSDASEIQIELSPNSVLTMNSNPKDKRFYTFSKDLKKTIQKQLTKVEISNITLQ